MSSFAICFLISVALMSICLLFFVIGLLIIAFTGNGSKKVTVSIPGVPSNGTPKPISSLSKSAMLILSGKVGDDDSGELITELDRLKSVNTSFGSRTLPIVGSPEVTSQRHNDTDDDTEVPYIVLMDRTIIPVSKIGSRAPAGSANVNFFDIEDGFLVAKFDADILEIIASIEGSLMIATTAGHPADHVFAGVARVKSNHVLFSTAAAPHLDPTKDVFFDTSAIVPDHGDITIDHENQGHFIVNALGKFFDIKAGDRFAIYARDCMEDGDHKSAVALPTVYLSYKATVTNE